MITRDLRRAIALAAAAAGQGPLGDPGLRPAGGPGRYAASIALTLAGNPRETARSLAARLAAEPWIAAADVTGPGYLTITVAPEALAAVADNVITAGPACVTSDALAGRIVPAAPPDDPLAAPTWEKARAALAVRLTARLAAAAGATVAEPPDTERFGASPQSSTDCETGETRPRLADSKALPDAGTSLPDASPASPRETAGEAAAARAVAFAGRDAVLFSLARAIPGKPLRVEPEIIARHVFGNPAYAVRYAHARAASGVRWAVASSAADTIRAAEVPELSGPAGGAGRVAVYAIGPARRDTGGYGRALPRGTTALLDALSWLPERVATAARRGRPDEFARYLEDLASVTVDVLSTASHPGKGASPGSDRLTLALAARTGLAAGLGLLEISAPARL